MNEVVIFGAGKRGETFYKIIKKWGIEAKFYCDNDSRKWNTFVNGIKVISPRTLAGLPLSIPIIIANRYAGESICRQLTSMGFRYIISSLEQLYFSRRITYVKRVNEIKTHVADIQAADVPTLSIIIIASGVEQEFINRCYESVVKNRIEIPYEILLWNGDKLPEPVGQIVVLLRADSMLQNRAIQYLLMQYKKYQGRCIVGAKTIDMDFKIKQAGYIIYNDFSVEPFGISDLPWKPQYEYVREIDAVSVNGMMMSRELWDRYVYGYDTWGDMWFNQIDFCLDAQERNVPIVFQPMALIIENGPDMDERQNSLPGNTIFIKKWENFVKKLSIKEESRKLSTINKKDHKYTVFFADEHVAEYDKSAGDRTVNDYIQILLEINAQLLYVPDNMKYVDKYTEHYQQMGILVLYGDYWNEKKDDWIIAHAGEFSYAFLNRPMIAKKYVSLLRHDPNLVIAHYGHDLHYLRFRRQYEVCRDKTCLQKSQELEELEKSLPLQIDYTGYPSPYEVEIMQKAIPEASIQLFPPYFYKEKDKNVREPITKGILFVGGFEHRPNIDAACWLVNEILPVLRNAGIYDKLYLVGSNPSETVKELQNKDIIVSGYVTDDELASYYHKCKVAVAPLQYGAGIKGKVLEAMYHGIPVVTTNIGAEGLKEIQDTIFIGDSVKDIVNHIINIYKMGQKEIQEIADREYKYVLKYFSKQTMRELILSQINKYKSRESVKQ